MSLIKPIRIFTLACLLSLGARAQSLIPAGTAQTVLPNGLQVVVIPTDAKDVVALQIVMRVGSRNEVEEGKSGFAHFFEHLMFRGTAKYPAAAADEMLKKAGVDSNAWTSLDQTVYHKVFLKEDLAQILDYEADRFMNLKFAEPEFRTEALAVLGEYNKNSANPARKMNEVLADTAFTAHTYKHTTMGFLEDIKAFPEGFDYAWTFFDRFYKPEYATIILVGDVLPKEAFALVEKEFGSWTKGGYRSVIPAEPNQTEPKKAKILWDSATLPRLLIAYKAPGYSDTKAAAALAIWEALAFSETSDLYRSLVLEKQLVDGFSSAFAPKRDPYLAYLSLRLTSADKLDEVRLEALDAFNGLASQDIKAERLEEVKSNLRYAYLGSLDSPAAIADDMAYRLSLDPDLSSIDRYFNAIASVTVDDLRTVAKSVFLPENQTIITLTSQEEVK